MSEKYLFDEKKYSKLCDEMRWEEIPDFIQSSIIQGIKDFAEKVRPIKGHNLDDADDLVDAGWEICADEVNNKITLALAEIEGKGDMIDDGFGQSWSAWCPMCKKKTMEIVRPGKVQCPNCG